MHPKTLSVCRRYEADSSFCTDCESHRFKFYSRKIPWVSALGLCGILLCASATADELTAGSTEAGGTTTGRLVKVTLYRDQALVTREIPVAAGEGEREIQIGRLPQYVVTDSVYAEGNQQVEVRGVRVLPTASSDSDRVEVRELTASIEENDRATAVIQQKLTSTKKQLEYIDRLMNFAAVSTNTDVSRGVLDAEALQQLSEYSMTTHQSLNEQAFSFETELQDLQRQRSQLEARLTLIAGKRQESFEATVVVATEPGVEGVFLLSYLVTSCGWEPQYTIRGVLGSNVFELRYFALVQQMSGEDWSNVQLTLSTASPDISAAGPVLTPFRISAAARPGQGMGFGMGNDLIQGNSEALMQKSRALRKEQSEVANQYAGSFSDDDKLSRDMALNRVASEFQNLELLTESKLLKTLASDSEDDVSSQTYLIKQSLSLASRREQHSVLIIEAELPGELYHVATPLLSSFAYREANILNDRPDGLLGGPATVYLDGRFVGRTELPSTASGQHLIVGFGADQQVRMRRELLSKSDDIRGGNRRLSLKYRLVVANFKAQPVALRLMDRIPVTAQGSDIQVDYDLTGPKLSEDGLYRRVQYPRGILRWDIEVPAERFGENAFDVEYSYSVAFDRTLHLSVNLGDEAQQSRDLFESVPPSGGMGGSMGGNDVQPPGNDPFGE